jgi:hypothetical protein
MSELTPEPDSTGGENQKNKIKKPQRKPFKKRHKNS